ncbi:hypothetical protein BJX99DRAFT_217001 [Aspergillus californicus]
MKKDGDIFKEALETLAPTTKGRPHPKSLAELESRLAETEKNFASNRGVRFWSIVERVSNPLKTAATIAEPVVSATAGAAASLVFGSCLHFIATARGFAVSYTSIGDFLARVAGTLERMTIYDETTRDVRLGRILAETIVLVSKILMEAARKLGRGKKYKWGKEFLTRLFFGSCSELEEMMAALQDLSQKEALTVISLIKKDTGMFRDELRQIDTKLSRVDRNIQREQFEDKLGLDTWHVVQNIHVEITKERIAGVDVRWILNEDAVKDWMGGRTAGLLWIHGEQGIGKSFISSRLISELTTRKKTLAYFYVRGNEANVATTIFKCLALQLERKSRAFRRQAMEVLNNPDWISNEQAIWRNLFVPFLQTKRPCTSFIIIDGLDAAPRSEQEKVLQQVQAFMRSPFSGKAKLCIAIISRSDLGLVNSTLNSEAQIQIAAKRTESDIARYIERKFSDPTRFPRLTDQDRTLAKARLQQDAKAMFLWVSLVIANLEELESQQDIQTFLKDGYPKNLTEHLGPILERVARKNPDQTQFKAVLCWIACTRRPLDFSQMQYIHSARVNRHNELISSLKTPQEELEMKYKQLLIFTTEMACSSAVPSTFVYFKHRCFKDHLLSGPRPPGFTRSEAHKQIFVTCLLLLQHPSNEPTGDVGLSSMINYAADHIIDHFMELEKESDLEIEAKQQLKALLRDPATTQRWYDAMSQKRRLALIPALLGVPRTYKRLTYWLRGSSPSEFFKPLAEFCAEAWLQTGSLCTQFCVLFQQNQPPSTLEATPTSIHDLSSGRIQHLAKFNNLEQNAEWHMRVASALRESNHLDDAIKLYREAEKKDRGSWVIKSGLAMAYAAQGSCKSAIQKAKDALALIPLSDGCTRGNLLLHLSVWHGLRGNAEAEIAAAEEAWALQPEDFHKTAHYFGVLGRRLEFHRLLEFCKRLDRQDGSGGSRLTQLLLGWEEGHILFGRAAVHTCSEENVKLAERVFQKLAKIARSSGDEEGAVFEQFQHGLFCMRHLQNIDKARKAWEGMGTKKPDDVTQKYMQHLKCQALSRVYLRKAIAARSVLEKTDKETHVVDTKEAKKQDDWVKKLERLAGLPNMDASNADAAVMLGYWRRKYERQPLDKDLFRAKICQGIRILEDEDPLNDYEGFLTLGKALLLAGHTLSAKRAFAGVQRSLEGSWGGFDSQPLVNISANSNTIQLPFTCNGKPDCKSQPGTLKRLHVCHVCHDIILCGECRKKLKKDQLKFTTCDKSHFFSAIYHRDLKTESKSEPGDQPVPDSEWLDGLKKTWGIDDTTEAAGVLPAPAIVARSQERRPQ